MSEFFQGRRRMLRRGAVVGQVEFLELPGLS